MNAIQSVVRYYLKCQTIEIARSFYKEHFLV